MLLFCSLPIHLVMITQSGGGTLRFTDQQRYAYLDIVIVDNGFAELNKVFQVQLSSPAGGGKRLGLFQ